MFTLSVVILLALLGLSLLVMLILSFLPALGFAALAGFRLLLMRITAGITALEGRMSRSLLDLDGSLGQILTSGRAGLLFFVTLVLAFILPAIGFAALAGFRLLFLLARITAVVMALQGRMSGGLLNLDGSLR